MRGGGGEGSEIRGTRQPDQSEKTKQNKEDSEMNISCSSALAQERQCELDMDLLCWGSGELGQTGHDKPGDTGPEEAHLTEFTEGGLGRVKLLACGSTHSIVVTADNKIFAWGNGTSGQLGDGERKVKKQPVEIKLPQEPNVGGSDVKDSGIVGVACGSRHSFIWTETGQTYSFGNNFYAQLGYDFQRADFKEHQLAPRLFKNLLSSSKISQVACGERHTLFALEDGSVAACGPQQEILMEMWCEGKVEVAGHHLLKDTRVEIQWEKCCSSVQREKSIEKLQSWT
ncbi:hypothetical protein Q5P01_014621 [Channa striata]|uniref:Uncharacterized protein n=1 Tax=Channa striata TaxID=64152 RepID=A0AA88MG25_CHASR|nr:hypothetical protein Q5P01_014621 [Channa striata]